MKPLLSICVPTFQRANIVYSTVLNHLGFKSNEIEVVVSDNCSEDNTVELLSNIKDSRLKIYRNNANRGFQYNLYNVVEKATGHFVCCISDQDILEQDELKKILEQIRNYVEDKCEIGAIVPGLVGEVKDKEEELLGLIYGRVAYMSGIILNRDLLEEKDFEIIYENYYAHIELLLKCGSRGKVVFSPYDLYRPYVTKDEEPEKRIKLEKNSNQGTCRITPYSAQSRYNQLKTEKYMILGLDIPEEIKFSLLTKQYMVKMSQGTKGVELLCRSEEKCREFGLSAEDKVAKKEYEIAEEYSRTIKEFFTDTKYIEAAKQMEQVGIENVQRVRQMRVVFDQLTQEQGYISVMAGKESYITQSVEQVLEYNFKIDYLCIEDKLVEHEVTITLDQLKNLDKVVLLVDGNDTEYINKLQGIEFKEAHLFYIQDLDIG